MNDRHLDSLELDALRAGEAGAAGKAHAEACPACREAAGQLETLARDLRGLQAKPFDVPAGFDRALMVRAALEMKRRPVARRFWMASAAAVVIVGIAGLLLPQRRPVDIVDAYRLALRLRAGDGTVDARDIEAIVRESVSLKGDAR